MRPNEPPVLDPESGSPNAQRVLLRGFALAALACRGFIDYGADNSEAEAVHTKLLHWLEGVPVDGEFSSEEAAIIHAPLGTLTETQIAGVTWGVEGLVVLSWALGFAELPPYDAQVDPYAVAEAIGLFDLEASRQLHTVRLRCPEEIVAGRELLYAINTRIREYLRSPVQGSRRPFQEWLDPEWLAVLKLPLETLVVDDELAIAGQPAWRASREQLTECELIVRERHRAAIWLAGEEVNYWDVRVDT